MYIFLLFNVYHVKNKVFQTNHCILFEILYAHLVTPRLGRTSLQVVDLVHACLTHPPLELRGERIIRRVLLLVPFNILANWQAEFERWIGNDIPESCLYN